MKWSAAIGMVLMVALMPAIVMAHGMAHGSTVPITGGDRVMPGIGMGSEVGIGGDFNEKRQEMREQWKERIKETKEYRERSQEGLKLAKEAKEEHRMRYMEQKEKYEKIKHRGLQDPEAFNTAKGFIVRGIGFGIAHLNELENRVLAMNLSENATAELLGDIEAINETLYKWEQLLSNITDPQEFKENVSAFNEQWKLLRIKIKAIHYKLVAYKFLEVVEKAKNRTWIIEQKIEKLEELGANTTKIEEAYQEYLNALSEVKEVMNQALQAFENAINSSDYDKAFSELEKGKELHHEAILKFRDSMLKLRYVFKTYAESMNATINESS